MLNRISRKISTFQIMLYIALVTGSVTPAMAAGNSTVKLPTPDDSFLKKIVNWMQSILDLVGGLELCSLRLSVGLLVLCCGDLHRNRARLSGNCFVLLLQQLQRLTWRSLLPGCKNEVIHDGAEL